MRNMPAQNGLGLAAAVTAGEVTPRLPRVALTGDAGVLAAGASVPVSLLAGVASGADASAGLAAPLADAEPLFSYKHVRSRGNSVNTKRTDSKCAKPSGQISSVLLLVFYTYDYTMLHTNQMHVRT